MGASTGNVANTVTGGMLAQNAVENNRQLHPEEIKFLHDKDRVDRFIAYYKEKAGVTLSSKEALAYLDNYGSALVDRDWAAIYVGNDADSKKAFEITSTFILKESPAYIDGNGNVHTLFAVSIDAYNDPTINLKVLFDTLGDKNSPYFEDVYQWAKSSEHLMLSEADWHSQRYEGYLAGQKAFDEMKSGDYFAESWLKALKSIPDIFASDEVGPFDSARMSSYYQGLLMLQGRAYEAGYTSSLSWAMQQQMAWEGWLFGIAGEAAFRGVASLSKGGAVAETPATSAVTRVGLRDNLAEQAGVPRNIAESPSSMWGKSVEDIKQSLTLDGATLTSKPAPSGTSGKAQTFTVEGHATVAEVQIHPGGGIHGAPYYKLTYRDGIEVRVIDPTSGFRPGTVANYQQYFDTAGNRLIYEAGQWKPWN
jgi:hypothetical protein